MRISHHYGFIYFSQPKTGSESMRAFLDPHSDVKIVKYPERDADHPWYSHMTPLEAQAELAGRGLDDGGYFRFMTVRNPWARLASFFQMMNRNPDFRWREGFGDWLRTIDPSGASVCHVSQKWYAHGMMSVRAFAGDAAGNLLVDAAFRIEDQLPDLCAALAAHGGPRLAPGEVAHTNAAPRRYDWRDMYSAADKAHVATLYGDEIEMFSYRFSDG